MDNPITAKIRRALETGPLASKGVDPVDPRDGRLFDAKKDRQSRVALFKERARSSGAEVHQVKNGKALKRLFETIVRPGATVGAAPLKRLESRLGENLADLLPVASRLVDSGESENDRHFDLDVALTGVELAVAETGSIVLSAESKKARIASLVAPVHVALLWSDQIESDLLDWADALAGESAQGPVSGQTVITGPSKTADIELKLVIGVHGPAALHLVVIDEG